MAAPPKNNLAEQMAILTKNIKLKAMLKRKRTSDPVFSAPKRQSTSPASVLSTTAPIRFPENSVGDVTTKPRDVIDLLSDDDDFLPPRSSQHKPAPTVQRSLFDSGLTVTVKPKPDNKNTKLRDQEEDKKPPDNFSLFDTDTDYDLFGTPVKHQHHDDSSRSSFKETVQQFGLLNETKPKQKLVVVSPDEKQTLKLLASPERPFSVMVKHTPTKGVKIIPDASIEPLFSNNVKDLSENCTITNSIPKTGEYLMVCREICELVGDCTQPLKPSTLSKIRTLQEKRADLERTRKESPSEDMTKTGDEIFQRHRSPSPTVQQDRDYEDVAVLLPEDADPPPLDEDEMDQYFTEEEAGDFFMDPPDDNIPTEEDPFSDGDDAELVRAADQSLANSQSSSVCEIPVSVGDTSFTASQITSNAKKISDHEEFARTNFPFSSKLLQGFKSVFGLHKFRKNQLECINATLLGRDCFVLMPTGGGKSLCYQLPAILKEGVTIVVSPLKSLIQDQVQKLVQLGIPASHLSGQLTQGQSMQVIRDLNSREPQLRLLYVTPEKIGCSNQLKDCFASLYQRDLLNRFVIDEAHCVSQWGHDFRPDYTKLSTLRNNYPRVPIMALTATAAPRVRADVLHNLALQQAKVFVTSFNRSNLKYILVPKPKKTWFEGVVDMINKSYKGLCGIVYCLSRKDCESCADYLKKSGVRAMAYHAGLTDIIRSSTQKKWIDDEIQVVCATIAFGMGIDKHDVRYVIHHTLPKSVEGFYQESGRAGRDGDPADCILLYNYCDVARIKNIIMLDGCQNTTQIHFDNLNYMVQYCENRMDCRRTQLLHYFGEEFSSEECLKIPRTSCDNCISRGKYVPRDLSEPAKTAVKMVSEFGTRNNFTLLHCCDVLRGAELKKVIDSGHQRNSGFGKMKGQPRSVIERLMRKLIRDGVLKESISVGFHGMVLSYVQLGNKSSDLLSGRLKIVLDVEVVARNKQQVAADSGSSTAVDAVVKTCYEALLRCRKDLAGEKKVAVHNILSNDTLHEMSEVRPHTLTQLLGVTGVTEIKIQFYGEAFLRVLQPFPPGKPKVALSDFKNSSRAGNSRWINTSGPPPFKTKPKGRGRGKARSSVPIQTPAPTASILSNVALMPLPKPKKPKPESVKRRL